MKRITVKKLPNGTYKVGYKIVQPDLEGRLISNTELTEAEKDAFLKHIHRKPIK